MAIGTGREELLMLDERNKWLNESKLHEIYEKIKISNENWKNVWRKSSSSIFTTKNYFKKEDFLKHFFFV